ncbi:MAG: AAA family ATPase [Cyclobacteriaceae bacterium]
MNVKEFRVEKLFGAFDHKISLNVEERITIIHGENGLGKTIILKMIKALYDANLFELASYNFSKFIMILQSNEKLIIRKVIQDEEVTLIIQKYSGRNKINEFKFDIDDESNVWRRKVIRKHYITKEIYPSDLEFELSHFLPIPIERIGSDRWLDPKRGRVYTTRELTKRFSDYLPRRFRTHLEIPDWFIEITDNVQVSFIETQRLLTRIKSEKSEYKSAVIEYSQHLAKTIKDMRAEATDLASRLDRTYPNRLVKRMRETSNISEEDLTNQLQRLEKKRELLNAVGLIDIEQEYIEPFYRSIKGQNENIVKDVLLVYVEDSNEKLEIYDDLTKRIKLLIDIVNKRFLYKKLKIDKEKGFVIQSTIEENKPIPLSGLSSGEQHELVLFYQLLFVTKAESFLLLDEPEISLHISWQDEFLNDLKEVIDLSNLTVLIATHSPDIIGNYWNLTTQLKGIK